MSASLLSVPAMSDVDVWVLVWWGNNSASQISGPTVVGDLNMLRLAHPFYAMLSTLVDM